MFNDKNNDTNKFDVMKNKDNNKNKKHINDLNDKTKVVVNILLVVIFSLASIYSIYMSFAVAKDEVVKYSEKGNIDYKIHLKKNDFYEKPVLDKGMVYVASLIDKIAIDYNYVFDISKKANIDYTYKIVGKLVISSQSNSNIFFEKEYDLTDEFSESIEDKNQITINKGVDINYTYYNSLANKFKSNYAVNTSSYLEVYLKVNEKSKDTKKLNLNNESKTTLTIPLSEQEVSIRLNNENVNKEKVITVDSKFTIIDYVYIFVSIVFGVITIILVVFLIKNIKNFTKDISNYDKYISRILRGYDRIIVNIKTKPNTKDYNVIKVENFDELIDVRDNVKEPIKYYIIEEHKKCEFFVTNDNDLYLLTVNAKDLDEESKDEKEKNNSK